MGEWVGSPGIRWHKPVALLAVGLLAIAGRGQAAETVETIETGTATEPVAFDRPGIGFATTVLARGGLAWEQGLPDFSSDRQHGEWQQEFSTESRLRIGLGSGLELQLAVDAQVWLRQPGADVRGVGDSSVALKWALPGSGAGFGWALLGSVDLASGATGVSAGHSARLLGLSGEWELPRGRGLALYLDRREQAGERGWSFSPSLTFHDDGRLAAYVEAGWGSGLAKTAVAGGGLTWRASRRVQLDASLLRGLDAHSPDWQGGVGVSVQLR